ncbi:MAG: hypothetical protein RSG50_01800 [Clostridia bacterium]
MASEFYGLKGKLVREYQEVLRSLGANIKVNGKWNKKTEAAFNQYRDQFLEAIGMKTPEPTDYQKMAFTPRDEAQLREAAQNKYGALYDGEIESLNRGARDKAQALEGQIAQLEPAFQNQLEGLKGQYKAQRQGLSDEALSRGLGRSSYVTDQISGSQQREIDQASVLAGEKEKARQALAGSITQLGGDLHKSTARLKGEREKSILAAIDEYRSADQNKALEAMKYNNDLSEKLAREQTERERFERELRQQLRLAKRR